MHEWVTVARTQGVPDGELAAATLDGVRIFVANAGGEYKAVADECTHAGCSLADDGELEGDSMTCQCHGSVFDFSTGEAIGPPATEPVAVTKRPPVRPPARRDQAARGGALAGAGGVTAVRSKQSSGVAVNFPGEKAGRQIDAYSAPWGVE
jgi:3-phenylpropionate/trans-cinnamate dioxygenase ferredoxin component